MKKIILILLTFFLLNFYTFKLYASANFSDKTSKRAFFSMNSYFENIPANTSSNGLLGFDNPANVVYSKTNNTQTKIFWSDKDKRSQDYNNWAIFSANPEVGIGLIKETENDKSIYNGRISVARGDGKSAFGFGYGFATGDKYFLRNEKNYWIFGALFKYSKAFDFGGTLLLDDYSDYREEQYYCLLKPLSNDTLIFSYEHDYQSSGYIRTLEESYSANLKFLKIVNLSTRFYSNGDYNFGLNISIKDEFEVIYNSIFDKTGTVQNTIYGIELSQKNENNEKNLNQKNEF